MGPERRSGTFLIVFAEISDSAIVAVVALVGTIFAALISFYASRKQSRATLSAAEAQNRATLSAAEAQNRATLEIAKAQNATTHEEGARERFAHWQLKKREVYAELLEQGRAHRDDPSDPEAASAFLYQAHRAMLFSNEDLRDELWKLVADSARLREEDRWRALVEELGSDARAVKRAD